MLHYVSHLLKRLLTVTVPQTLLVRMTLTVLRGTGQVLCRTPLHRGLSRLSHDETGVARFWKEDHGDKSAMS